MIGNFLNPDEPFGKDDAAKVNAHETWMAELDEKCPPFFFDKAVVLDFDPYGFEQSSARIL